MRQERFDLGRGRIASVSLILGVRKTRMKQYDPITIWAAILSTSLALIKILEMWRARQRVEFGCVLCDNSDEGNKVIIRNLSGSPIIVSYWEVMWLRSKWYRVGKEIIFSTGSDYDDPDIHLPANSSKTLTFSDERYFDWSAKWLSGSKTYLKIKIAGERRPRLQKIYG